MKVCITVQRIGLAHIFVSNAQAMMVAINQNRKPEGQHVILRK